MNDKERWLNTMNIYDEYERRFAQARADKQLKFPLNEEDRKAIIEETKKMIAFDEKMIPVIDSMEEVSHQDFPEYRVTQVRYETWKNFYGCSSIYKPYSKEPLPLVFLFCGHGDNARLTKSYVYLAHRLAKMGMAVIVPDNIGQGDRTFQGHWDCISPVYAGLTLQGLIVMESIALIRYMQRDSQYDVNRFGACGNSGAGILTLFLAVLAPELKAIASTGYSSEFNYVAAKEKPLCSCFILPGVANAPEMWEMLSTYAPKPLLLEQGMYDEFFPHDLWWRNARKLKNIYFQLGAPDNFVNESPKTTHSWVREDRYVIAKFLGQELEAPSAVVEEDEDEELLKDLDSWHVAISENTNTTDDLVENLTGIRMPENTTFQDIYPPMYQGKPVREDEVISDAGRGDVMRVLAQMEYAMKKL